MIITKVAMKVQFVSLTIATLVMVSACQTTTTETTENTVTPIVSTSSDAIKEQPFNEDLDPNDMENNPFAFNRM